MMQKEEKTAVIANNRLHETDTGSQMCIRDSVNAGLEPPEEGTHNFYHAPTAVLLSYETADENAGLNCGAAVENMLLAARSFGVASVFLGSLGFLFTTEEAEELKKQCGITENYSYCCAVALGYPSGEWPEAPEDVYKRQHLFLLHL